MLRHAAVVGRTFWATALEPFAAAEALRGLEARGFVVPRPASALPGHTEFAFVHGLTREVAYRSIPRADRCHTHAAVARWIESRVGDRREEFVELLAYHYEAAARPADAALAWPEGGEEVRAAAVRALVEAGDAARRRMAVEQAVRFADRALALAVDAERVAALELKGRSFHAAIRGDEALAAYVEAIAIADRAAASRAARPRDPALHALRRVLLASPAGPRPPPRSSRRASPSTATSPRASPPARCASAATGARAAGARRRELLAGGRQARRRPRRRDRGGDPLLAAAGGRARGSHVAVVRRGPSARRRARPPPPPRRLGPDRPRRGAREPDRGRHVLRARRRLRPRAGDGRSGDGAGRTPEPAPASARGHGPGAGVRALRRARRAAGPSPPTCQS